MRRPNRPTRRLSDARMEATPRIRARIISPATAATSSSKTARPPRSKASDSSAWAKPTLRHDTPCTSTCLATRPTPTYGRPRSNARFTSVSRFTGPISSPSRATSPTTSLGTACTSRTASNKKTSSSTTCTHTSTRSASRLGTRTMLKNLTTSSIRTHRAPSSRRLPTRPQAASTCRTRRITFVATLQSAATVAISSPSSRSRSD
mmetsp:Transcript_6679/g.20304  ORF Transcript_6679/g.20304 Transcript_6679/m.20304 type:complete len:205 (-) Transcript_6679:1845-2459(-)